MRTHKTLFKGLAAGARLAVVAFLIISLSTTPHHSAANTLPSVRGKVRARVAVPQPTAPEPAATEMDRALYALSPKDAALYRQIFAAQTEGAWAQADALGHHLDDLRLWGHVLADRLERQKADGAALAAWLSLYAFLPDAEDFYKRARKAGLKNLVAPQTPKPSRGGRHDVDGGAEFVLESLSPSVRGDSKTIQKALRRNDPWAALASLKQNKSALSPTAVAEAQAAIGAAFFALGERDQAIALTGAAAEANQPLGLWTRGLIAWEQEDRATARSLFTRLASHPSVTGGSRAAANFWAYRAQQASGNDRAARSHLNAAALAPNSFYGLLAAHLLGKNPIAVINGKNKTIAPPWTAQTRATLADDPTGWRALALLQVGQKARAQTELHRLNVQDDPEKIRALESLAAFASLPALSLHLASLSKSEIWNTAHYPLLPWQPESGYQVDRALLFALARQESRFDPSATSHRGAVGLMQLMPATANSLAKTQNGEDKAQATRLRDPAYNMELGQKYVQHLAAMPQIGNNLVLLLAAYNGGPAKAMSWAASKERQDPLLFLESIPLRETRHYIARVLPHYWAYRAKLGKPLTSLEQMAQGAWPRASLREDAAVRVAQAAP